MSHEDRLKWLGAICMALSWGYFGYLQSPWRQVGASWDRILVGFGGWPMLPYAGLAAMGVVGACFFGYVATDEVMPACHAGDRE